MTEQIFIFILGVSAIWLANDSDPAIRRWGCVLGLASQPFWFHTTFVHEQWGIFAASFVYAYSWWRGFRSQWLS
jgi:hypothetical protein